MEYAKLEVFYVWSSRSRVLRSLDDGELETWLQLAFRISGAAALQSVATSLSQLLLDSSSTSASRSRNSANISATAFHWSN
jgi:hypothetical protein